MGRHRSPDSDFDEEAESYPDGRTPRVVYQQGFLTGVIVAGVVALSLLVVYLAFIR